MEREELIKALREDPLDSRKASLSIYDLCIDAADMLENDQSHIAVLQKAIEDLRKQVE